MSSNHIVCIREVLSHDVKVSTDIVKLLFQQQSLHLKCHKEVSDIGEHKI